MNRVPATPNFIPLVIKEDNGRYELRRPMSDGEWDSYHGLRRVILFERRGRFGVYDAAHADELRPENHPFLFLVDGEAAGTIRIDIVANEALFRLVTIRETLQRQGHGRRMLSLAETFVRGQGRRVMRSHVNRDAIGFYERCGFTRDGPDEGGATVLMRKAPDGD
jgi:GNAT superfamily N-acetyltransferase